MPERTGGRRSDPSELILPHHALDGLIDLAAVFGIFFLVVTDQDLSIYREIDKLSYGHALIDLHRLFHGDLQGPVTPKSYVTLAGCGMDIDAQAAGRGFPFQERNMCMGLRI